MPLFKANVIETRNYHVEYLVEAATHAEALKKCEAGETLKESNDLLDGVTYRYVESGDVVQLTVPELPILAKAESYVPCSTRHMTRQDDELLTAIVNAGSPIDALMQLMGKSDSASLTSSVIAHAAGPGYFVYCFQDHDVAEVWPAKFDAMLAAGFSQAFVDVLNAAGKVGHTFVRFDADAEEWPGFPTFEW